MKFRKLAAQEKEQVTDAVLKLRYGQTKNKPMLAYSDIAKALKIPYATVQHICRYKPVSPKKRR